jgi:pilus assembly protein Flp/PilA
LHAPNNYGSESLTEERGLESVRLQSAFLTTSRISAIARKTDRPINAIAIAERYRAGTVREDFATRNRRISSDSHVDHKEPMMQYVSRFLKDQSGATAIEYGLIAAGISVAIIAVVNGLGTKLSDTFSTVTNNMK